MLPGLRLLVMVLTVAVLLAACAQRAEEQGSPTPTAAIESYLEGLAREDAAALARLVPAGFEAQGAIADKLAIYHGVDVGSLEPLYEPDTVSANIVRVRILSKSSAFQDSVDVQRLGTGWFIVLGRTRGFTPAPTTQAR